MGFVSWKASIYVCEPTIVPRVVRLVTPGWRCALRWWRSLCGPRVRTAVTARPRSPRAAVRSTPSASAAAWTNVQLSSILLVFETWFETSLEALCVTMERVFSGKPRTFCDSFELSIVPIGPGYFPSSQSLTTYANRPNQAWTRSTPRSRTPRAHSADARRGASFFSSREALLESELEIAGERDVSRAARRALDAAASTLCVLFSRRRSFRLFFQALWERDGVGGNERMFQTLILFFPFEDVVSILFLFYFRQIYISPRPWAHRARRLGARWRRCA